MLAQPKVAVIVLNFNGENHLRECLPALHASRYGNFEVIVVDNGSTDGSHVLLESFPWVRSIRLNKNLGFSSGNNIGIEDALQRGASLVTLLNNDTSVASHWLEPVVGAFLDDPLVGIVGSKLVNWDGSLVEYDGTQFDPGLAAGGYVSRPDDQIETPHPAPYACGAAMTVSAEVVRRIGLLDDSYFMYNEDVDYCLRAWISGYKVIYMPASVVRHRCGGSGLQSAIARHVAMRNALTTVLKNYQWRTVRRFYPNLRRMYWTDCHRKALGAVLYRLPGILVRRRRVQQIRRVSDDALFKTFIQAASPPGLQLTAFHESSAAVVGEIFGERRPGQLFTCTDAGLCRIDVFMATFARTNSCGLRFILTSPGGDLVAERLVDCAAVKDNAYHSFEFEPLPDSAGRHYRFHLESADAAPGNSVTIWYDPLGGDTSSHRQDSEEPATGSLRFRAYCRQREGSLV
ncbi:glycosyltransferase family 2 protein [bacterium]|nr:glycosyltransferase family 2 protein [candidate division CSSED10-310 bacterium]